jgi:hypothetical protein
LATATFFCVRHRRTHGVVCSIARS